MVVVTALLLVQQLPAATNLLQVVQLIVVYATPNFTVQPHVLHAQMPTACHALVPVNVQLVLLVML
jgi:hypothetical protein